jgi:hypothetical protein
MWVGVGGVEKQELCLGGFCSGGNQGLTRSRRVAERGRIGGFCRIFFADRAGGSRSGLLEKKSWGVLTSR